MVARAQRDPAAFDEIYRQHFGAIFGFVYRKLRQPVLAEDITSDVFVRALAAIGRFQPGPANLRSWLLRIASNRLIDLYRENKRAALLTVRAYGAALCAPDGYEGLDDDPAELHAALDSIAPRQRRALILHYAEDLTCTRVAEILGTSESAVKLLVNRGARSVRARMAA